MVAHLTLCLWLLQCGLAFAESGNILRRHQDRTRSAAAEELLGTRAGELAEALRAEYGDINAPSVADLIRGRLAQEASDLASEDSEGASLFSAFSQRAPIEVLVVPQHSLGGLFLRPYGKSVGLNEDDGLEDARVVGRTVSSESVMQSYGDGNMVVQTRQCKDGECMQTSKEISGNTFPKESGDVFLDDHSTRQSGSIDSMVPSLEKQQDTFMSMEDASSSVTEAVRRMAQDMQHIHDTFGDGALSSMFDNVYSQSKEGRDKAKIAGSSYSERTVVHNGRVFREIRRCENGECRTEQEESSADANPGPQEHKEQKPKPTMPF
mmetsp:Transcript_21813/g.49675  ORF Transcript_21813/g.49675 Transcript_21813/m.49675 type:complete len:322 (-) Transcript_21813:138-1103(-)